MKQDENTNVIQIRPYSSPCGDLLLGSFEGQLCICDWMHKGRREIIDKRMQAALHAEYAVAESEATAMAAAQLDEYFARQRTVFDVPLLFVGTDFQKTVWQELLNIPYGATISYATLAQRLGDPKAVRAVAGANGANPVSIFVPCHRVIGSDRKLTGYGGGLAAKRGLLELESGEKTLL